jgi:alkylation response protein AidB-like acyl-CoA dehydrogenase
VTTESNAKRLATLDALAPAFRERAARYDREAIFPEENFVDLANAGLLSLTVPEKWGGDGLWGDAGYVDYYEVLEHLASIDPPTGQLLQVHSHAMGMLAHVATEEQAQEYLIPIAKSGQRVASIGSESVPGKTNRGNSTSQLVRGDSGRWRLTCEKHFASVGPGADYLIIWTSVPGEENYDARTVAILVPRDIPEVGWINNWDTLGMRSTVSWGLRINDWEVPESAVFGHSGWFENSDPRTFTLGFAANHIGSARAALEFTIGWVQERPHLSSDPIIAHHVGMMSAYVQAARTSLFAAAQAWEEHPGASAELASVQTLAVAKEISLQVTQRALDVCGARSVFKRYQLEQIFRDTRTFTLHYRVDDYVRDLGASLIADNYDLRGSGGVAPAPAMEACE